MSGQAYQAQALLLLRIAGSAGFGGRDRDVGQRHSCGQRTRLILNS